MTTSSVLYPYQHFLSLTQNLLARAEAGEWETFATDMEHRQTLSGALSDQSLIDRVVEADLSDELRLLIAEINERNEQIAVIASRHRDELASEIRQTFQANKAISAYGR